jgi:hypothetical protein
VHIREVANYTPWKQLIFVIHETFLVSRCNLLKQQDLCYRASWCVVIFLRKAIAMKRKGRGSQGSRKGRGRVLGVGYLSRDDDKD